MAAMTAPLPLTRGRRVALALGVPVCLLLVANTGLDLVANMGQGTFPVSYAAPAGTRSLTVGLSGGQLLVTGTASSAARLTGTARYSLFRAHLTTRATVGGAVVGYQCVFPYGDCALDATVSVPAAMPVTASTDGGNATVTGTTGPVTLSTGGGDLSASHVSGRLSLNTSGGNIAATAIGSADVTAGSGGGDIEIVFASVPRDVSVSTSGGDITLVLPAGPTQYDVTAATDGGTVTDTLPLDTSSADVITATSGGGDITIRQQ
jgi:hypothetical protein